MLDLRKLCILMDKEKEHKQLVMISSVYLINHFKVLSDFSLVCTGLKPIILQKNYVELDNNFRMYSRAILTLATTIHRSRELRNLFIDLSQILDMWKQNNWSCKDLESFLILYMQCALEMDVLRCLHVKYLM